MDVKERVQNENRVIIYSLNYEFLSSAIHKIRYFEECR